MRIYYLSVYDFLRARTNQIADIRFCEGFAQAGCEVEIIAPYVYRRDNMRRDEVFARYGVKTPFRLKILRTPFVDDLGPYLVLPLLLVLISFCCLRIWLTNLGRLSEVVIISQTTDLLVPAILLKKLRLWRRSPLLVTWAHDISMRGRYIWGYRNSDAIIGTNSAITGDLTQELGIDPARLAITLNPISEAQLEHRVTREAARVRLGLSVAGPLVVYTGKLHLKQREADFILEAARRLPGYHFLLTGGKPQVVQHYREFCEREGVRNVTFVGFLLDYTQVSLYQAAADVLVSYYTTAEHLTRYQLPNKTCEYMLAGNPIVTCDFPATRDVLHSGNAIFVEPENVEALSAGIRRAVEDRDLAQRIAARALEDVRGMTYRRRAAALVEFFRGLVSSGA